MWIGSLALARRSVLRRLLVEGRDPRGGLRGAAHRASALYGFFCGTLAAFLTAFYSWRLLILTFHGRPRADEHTMEHVHESPPVMLVPLMLLASARCSPGWAAARGLHRRGVAGVLARRDRQRRRATTCWSRCEHVPLLIASAADRRWRCSASRWPIVMYMVDPDPAGAARGDASRRVYRFLLNKWYFDELYDFLFVRPAQRAGARALAGRRRDDHRRRAERARGADRGRLGARWCKIQTGSIAVYAFTMLIGLVVLVSIFLLFR